MLIASALIAGYEPDAAQMLSAKGVVLTRGNSWQRQCLLPSIVSSSWGSLAPRNSMTALKMVLESDLVGITMSEDERRGTLGTDRDVSVLAFDLVRDFCECGC